MLIVQTEEKETEGMAFTIRVLSLFLFFWPVPKGQEANDGSSSSTAEDIYIHPVTMTAVSLIP